jgi:hypothetical protein
MISHHHSIIPSPMNKKRAIGYQYDKSYVVADTRRRSVVLPWVDATAPVVKAGGALSV